MKRMTTHMMPFLPLDLGIHCSLPLPYIAWWIGYGYIFRGECDPRKDQQFYHRGPKRLSQKKESWHVNLLGLPFEMGRFLESFMGLVPAPGK
jgi:hypothetical protein